MLEVIERAFGAHATTWRAKLVDIIPSYGQSLADNPKLCSRVRGESAAVLHLRDLVLTR